MSALAIPSHATAPGTCAIPSSPVCATGYPLSAAAAILELHFSSVVFLFPVTSLGSSHATDIEDVGHQLDGVSVRKQKGFLAVQCMWGA